MNSNFWQEKKILITGHSGFKGSWLTIWLHSMGANIHGLSLKDPVTDTSLYEESRLNSQVGGSFGDIRDFKFVLDVMHQFKPEIVIHMAAQSLVRRSYQNPLKTYTTNVIGTANILEAARMCGSVKAILNVTSDKCYENQDWVWGYRENDPMGGADPYSSSKGCAEIVGNAYYKSYFKGMKIGLASARAGNVIGGGDWAEDRLIPDIVRAYSADKVMKIRNPKSTRPWQHVLEPLSGYLLLTERLWGNPEKYSCGWNFGPNTDDAKNVNWIVDKATHLWGKGANWTVDELEGDVHEANQLKLDVSQAKQNLDWRPKWSVEIALEKTIAWYKQHLCGINPYELCLEEIRAYQEYIN